MGVVDDVADLGEDSGRCCLGIEGTENGGIASRIIRVAGRAEVELFPVIGQGVAVWV